MTYSPEMIKQVAELASNLTPISDIAVLLELDIYELRAAIHDRDSPVSRAYHRAKAETLLAIRKNELQLASMGSLLAVQLAGGYAVSMSSDEDL